MDGVRVYVKSKNLKALMRVYKEYYDTRLHKTFFKRPNYKYLQHLYEYYLCIDLSSIYRELFGWLYKMPALLNQSIILVQTH